MICHYGSLSYCQQRRKPLQASSDLVVPDGAELTILSELSSYRYLVFVCLSIDHGVRSFGCGPRHDFLAAEKPYKDWWIRQPTHSRGVVVTQSEAPINCFAAPMVRHIKKNRLIKSGKERDSFVRVRFDL